MQKFTVHNQKEINQKIETDLAQIKKIILKSDDDIVSIILVGGFGRGEGSVILKNNKIQIVNDYDIVIITKKALPTEQIKILSERIIKELSIRLVDLIPYRISDLSSLPLTIFNYDLKYASHIFFGDKNILNLLPEYESELIPLSEGKNLLINRLICLTESFSKKFVKKRLSKKQFLFLVNQCSKAVLAVSDSLLLLRKKYHPSYQVRAKMFNKEYGKMKKLNSLVSEATEFKLMPQDSILLSDPANYWYARKEIFLSNFLNFMNSYYKRKFLTVDEFVTYYLKANKPGLVEKIIKALGISTRSSNYMRTKIDSAQILILAAYEKNSIKKEYLKKAQQLLGPYLDKTNRSLSWEQLRKANVKLWYKYFH